MMQPSTDRDWMAIALAEAGLGAEVGEVPIGAVLVHQGELLAKAHNQRHRCADPLGHAELLVIASAAKQLGRWRLHGCTLYVTLEPCAMCAGALVNARLDRVVFGAWDQRAGAVGSVYNIAEDERLNHRVAVTSGVEEDRSKALLQAFFRARRHRDPLSSGALSSRAEAVEMERWPSPVEGA